MLWERFLERADRIEQALTRLRERLLPPDVATVTPIEEAARMTDPDDLRLFPIVGRDLCYPVAALLAQGELEKVSGLVSERAWVASTPLYG
jgi:hypothetical protein